MPSLMTHGLMSLFSVMGQKGKLPFRDHLLCKVVSSKYISIELKKGVYSSIVLEYRLSQAEVAHICVFCPPQVVVPCVCKQLQQIGRT